MAKKPPAKRTGTSERNGREVIVYENGLERYSDTGKIARPPDHVLITTENSTQYHRARQEKKRAVIAAAANQAVERQDYRDMYGDLAFAAAIAEAQYIKATTPDDPKSTDAARFLMAETGLADTRGDAPLEQASEFVGQVRELVKAIAQLREANEQVIDAE